VGGVARRGEPRSGRYPDPDAFDVFRDGKQHLPFGEEAHRCLGMHLARLGMRMLLNVVLDRLPGLPATYLT
jgi:cytochrome P450